MEGTPNFSDERSFRDDFNILNTLLLMLHLLNLLKLYFYCLCII